MQNGNARLDDACGGLAATPPVADVRAMHASRARDALAILFSIGVHVAAFAMLLPQEPPVMIAGGEAVEVTVVGDAFLDALLAGQAVEQAEEVPVEMADAAVQEIAEPVETVAEAVPLDQAEPVEPVARLAAMATPTMEVAQPVAVEMAAPVEVAEAMRLEPAEASDVPEVLAVPVVTPDSNDVVPVAVAEVMEAETAEPVEQAKPQEPLAMSGTQAVQAETVEAMAPAKPEAPVEMTAVQPMEATETVVGEAPDGIEEYPELAEAPVPTPRPDDVPAVEPEEKPRTIARGTPKPARQATAEKPAKPARQAREAPVRTAKDNAGHGGQSAADARAGGSAGRAAARGAGNAAVSNYPGQVTRKLRRALRYPKEAGRGRLRGEVAVSFVVHRDGNAASIRVVRSSGHPVLDAAAMDTVRRAAPFPPIPDSRPNWSFTVPLLFRR